ncbi:MAG: hypothetical protein KJ583_01500 [Nanoarchaeota archaeon]|nr:hypothetical protein [Nanoarchaeota archaeon]MBU1270319.1 hypothetical protein [Nanoarchaeota archaeon]MBU1603968.1 hypothetical protein [Nanoarchaeota archaeon]MBU2443009.1 hypothetical protein [Nanoarchaeota archaeon]
MRLRNKKGSLNLSIEAIVILVMAMAILGLGLGFIRGLITKGQGQFTTAIDNAELENPATADNPMTVDRTVNVKTKGTGRMKIGFYNGGANELLNAQPILSGECKPDGTNSITFQSGPQKIGIGEGKGWEVLVKDNASGSSVGSTTICTLKFNDGSNIFASRQFQVNIVS